MKLLTKIQYSDLTKKILMITIICSLVLSAQMALSVTKQPRFIIILLDETESFALYKDGKPQTMFWPEVLPYTAKVIKSLQPVDMVCVIGIDDHGFDDDDIRIPVQTLDMGILKSIQETKGLTKQVKALERRKEKHKTTDILGALSHAAYLLKKQDSHQGKIVIFSDMIQEPALPSAKQIAGLKLPENTDIFCLYVNATGKGNWDTLVNAWTKGFNDAGLNVTEKRNFYQRGEVKSFDFEKLLQ